MRNIIILLAGCALLAPSIPEALETTDIEAPRLSENKEITHHHRKGDHEGKRHKHGWHRGEHNRWHKGEGGKHQHKGDHHHSEFQNPEFRKFLREKRRMMMRKLYNMWRQEFTHPPHEKMAKDAVKEYDILKSDGILAHVEMTDHGWLIRLDDGMIFVTEELPKGLKRNLDIVVYELSDGDHMHYILNIGNSHTYASRIDHLQSEMGLMELPSGDEEGGSYDEMVPYNY